VQDEGILLTGGLILVAGSVAGLFARLVRLPTLTGYLAAGILLGPYGFDLLPHARAEALARPVTDLTMALVLFVLGGQFRVDKIRGKERPTLVLSAVEAVITALLVVAVAWPILGHFSGALLLGVMAVAVAPATTLAVLQEYDADGPTSLSLQLVTALSNVWSIFFFEMALLVLVALRGGDATAESLAWAIAGSVLYGVLAGHALIVLQGRVGFRNYALPLLTILLLTIGLCKASHVPFMLTFLVTGGVVVNRSRYFESLVGAMENFAQPAYAAFFVLSGWHLDFEVLGQHWLAAGAYVLARTVGKVAGARAGLRLAGLSGSEEGHSPNLGLGLLCQAGAAIALAHLAMRYDQELGRQLLTIILGGVVIFELLGPLLVKRVVLAAGEVRIGKLLVRPGAGDSVPWRDLLQSLVRGRRELSGRGLDELHVSDVMRAGVKPLPANSSMDDMLRYANQSALTQYPVVSDQGQLRGVIRLEDLSQLVYDPQASAIVIADDVISVPAAQASLAADASIDNAAEFFSSYDGNAVPVVDNYGSRRYRGIVERAEVLRLVREARRS
jgi:Kef-type K+ transport system membrane component KefB